MRTAVTKDVFFAISDPTRRAVLDLLAGGSRKAGDIAARFSHLTQPGVSRHLKVLRRGARERPSERAAENLQTESRRTRGTL